MESIESVARVPTKMLPKKSKQLSWIRDNKAFQHMLRASGQSEVWWDYSDEAKFHQYGWRCSTTEDSYSNSTLTGNWNEERSDMCRAAASPRPLPNQFCHYFETTYHSSYKKDDPPPVKSKLKGVPGSFPGHQPVLDPSHAKFVLNSSYRADFKSPREDASDQPSVPHIEMEKEIN